jgi:hypothetical protein
MDSSPNIVLGGKYETEENIAYFHLYKLKTHTQIITYFTRIQTNLSACIQHIRLRTTGVRM